MKTIGDVYSEYRIMPTLQQHQLRVASVAKFICESLDIAIDVEGVVRTCLLHDMGNIIKFDLSYFPDFVQPEGLEYWQAVKDDYISRYGPGEHAATETIFHELGMSDVEMSYLDFVGFSRIKKAVEYGSFEQKICCYSDQRVGPHGVLSIQERLIEGRKRYAGRKDKAMDQGRFEELAAALQELERQIFSHSSLKPESISDAAIGQETVGITTSLNMVR